MQERWALELKRSGFRDIEKPNGQLVDESELFGRRAPTWHSRKPQEAVERPGWHRTPDYYRRAASASWRLPGRILENTRRHASAEVACSDRMIARWLAEGRSVREIKAGLRVGRYRLDRVRERLHELMRKEEQNGDEES